MGGTLLGSLTLVEIECANCITHFAMDSALHSRCRETGRTFYCPNGHSNWYKDNDLDRLRKENQNIKTRLDWAERGEASARLEAETAKREKAAIKGQLTKTRNRIAHGVCPCCHRTFKQLAAHMQNKHPDFKAAVTQ